MVDIKLTDMFLFVDGNVMRQLHLGTYRVPAPSSRMVEPVTGPLKLEPRGVVAFYICG